MAFFPLRLKFYFREGLLFEGRRLFTLLPLLNCKYFIFKQKLYTLYCTKATQINRIKSQENEVRCSEALVSEISRLRCPLLYLPEGH